jgi:hypothetical protein
MMLAAMTIDEVDPPSGESFKGVDLAGINSVVDDARNHFDALHPALTIGFHLNIAEAGACRGRLDHKGVLSWRPERVCHFLCALNGHSTKRIGPQTAES